MFKNHPKGLLAAALSNMGERFGYYIMNAVLVLFLCSKFGLTDEKATTIYSFFYAGIYILSLVGGLIADRTQNYKGTIMTGLMIMASGYIILSVPLMAAPGESTGILVLTCVALFLIAFGNGLFKGNLQAIVGQMYDNFEAEAAKKGEEALRIAKSKRDSGFQIFYMFINVGGLIAPFVAPLLRSWWLGNKYSGNLMRSAVELAELWRNDKLPRRLEAMMIVADKNNMFILSGSGEVIEPDGGVCAIGSGGNYALAAGRALYQETNYSAEEIAYKALKIAGDICIFTNDHITVESI